MSEKVARVANVVSTAMIVIVAAIAVLLVAGRPFGVQAFAVLSGSMEPAYSTGDLIYVKKTDASDLGPGDAVTFMTGKDTTVTHRIVAEVEGEDGVTRFQTQGDANDTPDGGLVHPDNVIGVPVFAVPMLGYLVNFVQFPPGTYVAISFCAVVVFLMFLPDLLPSKEDEEEKAPRGRHASGAGSAAAAEGGASWHASTPTCRPVAYARQDAGPRLAGDPYAAARSSARPRAGGAQPCGSRPPSAARQQNGTKPRPAPVRAAGPSASCVATPSGANNPRLAKTRAQAPRSAGYPALGSATRTGSNSNYSNPDPGLRQGASLSPGPANGTAPRRRAQ